MNKAEFEALAPEDQERLKEGWEAQAKSDGKELIKEKDGGYIRVRLTEAEEYKIIQKFKDSKLIFNIKKELDKDHLGDGNLKLTTNLICVSSLLENPRQRMSMGITGDSSSGKNNLIEANLKHLPDDSYIYVSSATQSTLEEDIDKVRLVAFKEINFNKEDGENKHLLGVWKQLVEGGTKSLKKDVRTGYKTSRYNEGEQKSTLYPTTETERDVEGETRVIFGGISTSPIRIKKVNDNTLDSVSELNRLVETIKEEDSWVKKGLTIFFNKPDQPLIYIPYAKFLKEQIDGENIFDNNNLRSQRDIKRLLALTSAMTYLYQEQRESIKHKGKNIIISEPIDFINTLAIAGEFFNQTYSGLDIRLKKVIEIMKISDSEWVGRDFLQEQMVVTRNTIKSYCQKLSGEGLIEGNKGTFLNEQEGIKIYDGNKIYYRRCQKGVKKPLVRCEILRLKEFLEVKTQKPIDTFELEELSSINEEKEGVKGIKNKGVNSGQNTLDNIPSGKIDTFSLTPLEKPIETIKLGDKKDEK